MQSTLSRHSLAALALVLSASSCKGTAYLNEDAGCVKSENEAIRLKLAKTCKACHQAGSRPFFASLETFEATLVYNTKWVLPGDPDGSPLMQLLRGQGSGSFTQMPPVRPYSEIDADGIAPISMHDLEEWIRTLPAQSSAYEGPNVQAATTRRLTAEEIMTSMMQQLGLELSDFVSASGANWKNEPLMINGGKFFVYPPDRSPTASAAYGSDTDALRRFEALGGPNSLSYRPRERELTPAALQVIVQGSQAWCRQAVQKPSNPTFFAFASKTDTSAMASEKIKKNIEALWLSMLGEPPSAADVDELYTQVFLAYEPKGPTTAWTAVCSQLMRDPKWLLF